MRTADKQFKHVDNGANHLDAIKCAVLFKQHQPLNNSDSDNILYSEAGSQKIHRNNNFWLRG